ARVRSGATYSFIDFYGGLYVLFFFFFFFSSRRRHTRWPRDWSSDVCSSDLAADFSASARFGKFDRGTMRSFVLACIGGCEIRSRSEERRVGKECKFRRSRDCYKKKINKKYKVDG